MEGRQINYLRHFSLQKKKRSEFKDKILLSVPYPVLVPYPSQDCFSDLSSLREVH